MSPVPHGILMSEGTQRVEQFCLLLTLVIFFARGICGGCWRRASEALAKGYCWMGIVLFAILIFVAVVELGALQWVLDLWTQSLLFSVCLLQNGLGHLFVIL